MVRQASGPIPGAKYNPPSYHPRRGTLSSLPPAPYWQPFALETISFKNEQRARLESLEKEYRELFDQLDVYAAKNQFLVKKIHRIRAVTACALGALVGLWCAANSADVSKMDLLKSGAIGGLISYIALPQ